MALSREQRRQMLAQEVHGVETEVDAIMLDAPAPAPPEPVAVPAQAPTADMAALVQMLAAALQGANQSTSDQIAQALRDNRKPIPENTDAEYHGRSHYHPAGKDAPRPSLTVETWCGAWDHDEQKASPKWRYEEGMLRDDEIETLNALPVGEHRVERNDGQVETVRVVDQRNAEGQVYRRVLAYPRHLFLKEHANQIPHLASVRRQVLVA